MTNAHNKITKKKVNKMKTESIKTKSKIQNINKTIVYK